ncbi:MAG: TIR domain-containing protein [Ktedonobacteraceae bacterium]
MTTTVPRSRYPIFISHNKTDNKLGYWLADELRRILGDKNAVWYDSRGGRYSSRAGMRPGDDWPKTIADNIRSSKVFLLLWSNQAKNGNGVKYELSLARRQLVEKKIQIIPICINGCSLPFELRQCQYISYNSGEDFEPVLDGILRFLRLPPEVSDPKVRAEKRVVFEIEEAFKNKEWSIIIQQFEMLSELYPEAISSSICYMFAISLLELGQVQHAKEAHFRGLLLDNDDRSNDLLHAYADLLAKKQLWQDLRSLAEQALQKFPHDTVWYSLREQAYINLSQKARPFSSVKPVNPFPPNPMSPIYHDASTIQLRPTNFPNLPDSQNVDTVRMNSDPVTENFYFNPDESPQVTTKLSDEEEDLDIKSGTWQSVTAFTDHHLANHRLSMLWTPSWIFTLFLNLILLPLFFFMWPLSSLIIWTCVVSIVLVLALGKIFGKEVGPLFTIPTSLFWGVAGFCLSYYLYHFLGWKTSSSITTWLESVCTVLSCVGGFCWHLKLFRN